MAAPARRMNGSWERMVLFGLLCALLLLRGAVSQDMTTEASATGAVSGQTVPPDATGVATDSQDSKVASSDEVSGSTVLPTKIPTIDTLADTLKPTDADPISASTALVDGQLSINTESGSTISSSGGLTTETAKSPENLDAAASSTIDPNTAPATEPAADPTTDPAADPAADPTAGPTPSPAVTESEEEAIPVHNIQCVDKEAVKDRDAVKIKLSGLTNCEDTKSVFEQMASELCGEGCNLELYQEENSKEIIVTGRTIKGDVRALADRFQSEALKETLGVVKAEPFWGTHPPIVLVSLLLAGLLLMFLLIGAYVWKSHRAHTAKGMRLAEESYQADEENQGNTLVSVAPLNPPELQEKPSANGESPKGGKSQPPPTSTGGATTNGHSATKTPVADTEL